MKRLALLLLSLAVLLPAGQAQAESQTYTLDTDHGLITFAVEHFSVSRMWCMLPGYEGTIEFDAEKPENSSVEVTIQTNSLIAHGSEGRRDAVTGPAFLNVEEYPEIVFKSSSVKKSGDHFTVTGDITIHGVTKEVEMKTKLRGPTTDPWGNPRIGILGTLEVNRKDFGITTDPKTEDGRPFIGEKVEIMIEIEAIPKPAEE